MLTDYWWHFLPVIRTILNIRKEGNAILYRNLSYIEFLQLLFFKESIYTYMICIMLLCVDYK